MSTIVAIVVNKSGMKLKMPNSLLSPIIQLVNGLDDIVNIKRAIVARAPVYPLGRCQKED